MSLKLLLTEASSALGQALEHEFEREPFNLLVPRAADFDWSDVLQVDTYLQQQRPDIVVNCRGWDAASSKQEYHTLVDSATHLAASCGALNIPLIHFSSYSVFGEGKGTHSEKDAVAPISAAGHAFVAAEHVIAAQVTRHIILRMSWVIGACGDNLLTRLLESFLAGAAIDVNRRLRGAPTAFTDVARVMVAIVKQINCGAENWGPMHYCSSDACTEEEFAEQLLQLLIQQQLLSAEPSLRIVENDPVDEPISAILGCRRLRDYFGIQARSWRPSLLPLVKQWLHKREQVKESC